MPPPRRPKKLCGSSLRMSERMPGAEESASSITTASFGSVSPTAWRSASGCTGVLLARLRAFATSASRSAALASLAPLSRSRAAAR